MWFAKKKHGPDIEERLYRVEMELRRVQDEWLSAYDKMRTLTARFVKRAEQIEKHERLEDPTNGSLTGSTTATSALDPISARILDRRRRMFPTKEQTP